MWIKMWISEGFVDKHERVLKRGFDLVDKLS
jgi:hypothetical protein